MNISILLLLVVGCAVNNACPRIKSKQQWEGIPVLKEINQTMPFQNAIIHHTVSNKCESFAECSIILQNIQNYHISKRGFIDIAYNFMIGNDGLVYEGRGWDKIGSHTQGFNSNSLGISFIGNFTSSLPTQNAFSSLKQLLECGVSLGKLSENYNLLAARQVYKTISPGLPIFGEIQEWDHWSLKNSTYLRK